MIMKKSTAVLALLFAFCFCSFAQSPLFTNVFGVQAYTYRNSWGNGITKVLDSIKAWYNRNGRAKP
jgi:hypothetical protein